MACPICDQKPMNADKPVAWAVAAPDYQYVSLLRESAEAAAAQEGGAVVTLYRQPALTDEEREAIAAGLGALERLYEDSPPISKPIYEQHAPTLRGLLERTSAR